MMQFDLETLHLSSALSRAAYLVVFMIVALRQPREICLWHWIGAILTSMLGSTIIADVPTSRWLTSGEALAIYTAYAASLILSWSGLRLFNDRGVPLSSLAALSLIPGLIYVAGLAIGIPMRSALAGVILLCSVYAAIGALEAVRRTRDRRLWSAYIVSATLSSYAVMLLLTLALLVGTDMPMNSSESAVISMVVDQASGILVYFGYIAMAQERALLTIGRIAETDPLTGLVNRRGLLADFKRRSRKLSAEQPAGIILADIDHFKAINDTHGHDAGDAVLVAFAQRLRSALRKDDISVRWGGEEFLAVLPQIDTDLLDSIAERFRRAIQADPFQLPSGEMIEITVSVGISQMPFAIAEFERATGRADAALYEAKKSGRNRICRAPLQRNSPSLVGQMA